MLMSLTECIITTLSYIIKLYKIGNINYSMFIELSQNKISFLIDNYDDIIKIIEIEQIDMIINQCQGLLNINNDENLVVI